MIRKRTLTGGMCSDLVSPAILPRNLLKAYYQKFILEARNVAVCFPPPCFPLRGKWPKADRGLAEQRFVGERLTSSP